MRLRARNGFTEDQEDTVWDRQGGRCPCCGRSLSHVGCGWDAHHRNGERHDNRTSNLVLCCVDCHHNCYHNERDVSRKPIYCRVSKAVPTVSVHLIAWWGGLPSLDP